ncbi:hypothetical protein [Dactylosporangium sp. NPDC000521]|uniref:hypothetical protein n=1 Tax=Dactylosporangium sp. NPDC000521 TaxID=3363975 RepID=UPI003696AAB0
MGLNMVVGVLADDFTEEDDAILADLTAIGAALRLAGAASWHEPAGADHEEFEMWGYSGLHAVRRLAVHLAANDRLPEPLAEGERATTTRC